MTTRTVEYTRYRIPADRSAEFLAAYTHAAVPLAAAPQCVDYELTRCEEDFEHYVLRITWTSTEDHLTDFRGSELSEEFLAHVRPYVGYIEETRHYTPTAVRGAGASTPAFSAWAGGEERFARLTEAFRAKARADDLLAPLFAGLDPAQAAHVAQWLGEVVGGPARAVTGRPGQGVTEPQRRRWVGLLQDAADEAGLPTDAEFRSAFTAHIEWGTRLAVRP
ncbi:antibiotic biosynthesis monooxygenase [Streptomyces sp. NPDC002564]|uniref:antibiotic biosynthesis monooxygenase n=1 Tax=Streptomyces sp. NPDC002564 TaxID=3364649 RepID=UPI0036A8199B